MGIISTTILLGIFSTLFMDIYSLFMKIIFRINGLDYRFVGRWVYHMKDGVFAHSSIFNAKPASFEVALGWITHYIIGILFSFLLIFVFGTKWLETPSLIPALSIGLITVLAPFFIMQPAFGLGIAGALTPEPNIIKLKSLMAHLSFGVGLYLSALVLNLLK